MTKPQGGPITITDWGYPTSKIKSSVHGLIKYKEWCRLETKRINAAGTECRVSYNSKGMCAVVPWNFRDGREG